MNASLNSIREVRKLYDIEMAFDFNSFNFLKPGENKTSEILAFFLDPKQTHAQGDIFLNYFLKVIGFDEKCIPHLSKRVSVKCEHYTNDKRKIDIVILLGEWDFAIGIENKIYSGTKDQDNQLSDYADYLSNQVKKSRGEYLLLYLAPKNKQPAANSISNARKEELENADFFKVINYEDHIIDCVRQWAIICQPVRVKSFLQDFEQYLKRKYKGEKFMSELKGISDFALKNSENLETALSIINAGDEIKKRLFEKISKPFLDAAEELKSSIDKMTIDFNLNSDGWTGFLYQVKGWNKFDIKFVFEEINANRFICGITIKEGHERNAQSNVKLVESIKNSGLEFSEGDNSVLARFYYQEHFNNFLDKEILNDLLNQDGKHVRDEVIKQVNHILEKTKGIDL